MTKQPWTRQELAVVTEWALSDAEVASKLNRTIVSVQRKRERLRAQNRANAASSGSGCTPIVLPPEEHAGTVDDDLTVTDNEYWERHYKALKSKYQKLLEEKCITDRLIEDIKELAPLSYNPLPPVHEHPHDSGGDQAAVLMLSDTHVGQVVTAAQTLGAGGYDLHVFAARLKKLEIAIKSILTGHVNTRVPELVIWWGGDMLHGNLNHAAEADHVVTLFDQFFAAGHAFAQFTRNLATLVPRIRCYTVVGNHTRWGTQKRMPTANRYSNLDQFTYSLVEALTRDIKHVSWYISQSPYSPFDVNGYSFLGLHGDNLRGGDRALGVPAHAIGRLFSTINQIAGKECIPAPHYFLAGHLHRPMTLPHGRGAILVNGGFPGLDGYALSEFFAPCDPVQRFFLVHKTYGITASYDIALKYADPSKPSYDLPI